MTVAPSRCNSDVLIVSHPSLGMWKRLSAAVIPRWGNSQKFSIASKYISCPYIFAPAFYLPLPSLGRSVNVSFALLATHSFAAPASIYSLFFSLSLSLSRLSFFSASK